MRSFYNHQLSPALSPSSWPSTKELQQRAAGAPYWLPSQGQGLSQEINGCFYPLVLHFMCRLTQPPPPHPFCEAISIQMSLFTNIGNQWRASVKWLVTSCFPSVEIRFIVSYSQTQAPFDLHNTFQEFHQAMKAEPHIAIRK